MSRLVGVLILVVILGFGAAAVVTWVARSRVVAARAGCENNLRELGRFAADHAHPAPADGPRRPAPPDEIPAGTAGNLDLPPDKRLSWLAAALPRLDQRRLPAAAQGLRIDPNLPWDADSYRAAARVRLPVVTCPGNPAELPPTDPAVSQYLGLSGLDPGGADLDLGPPVPPGAGCFRYNGPTPFDAITDGLSNTLLFGETNRNLGPWLRGGPGTVRGYDPGSRIAIGVGGQFGGNHPEGAIFGFADGSGRLLTAGTDPVVLRNLMTIAGGADEVVPGD